MIIPSIWETKNVPNHQPVYEWRPKCLTRNLDMAKVGAPLSVVKVCTSMLCAKIGYRQVGDPLSVVNVFTQFEHPMSTPHYELVVR